MKNILFKLSLVLIIMITFSTTLSAQLPPMFDPTVNDTSGAPISGFVALGLIVGAAVGYKKLRK